MKFGLLTSGGDAPGMNAAIRAFVRLALVHNHQVLGIERGFDGLIHGEAKPLTVSSVADIVMRGGTILRTSRFPRFHDPAVRQSLHGHWERWALDGLVVLGGNGSLTGALALTEDGFPVVGIPASIDGDVALTDYSLGFDTALNNITSSMDKIRDTASAHERIFVVEVMGNGSGQLAVAAGLAAGAEAVLIPEIPVDYGVVADRLNETRARGKRHSFIVVAEGVASAVTVADVIGTLTGYEVKAVVLGHTQRGGPPTAQDRLMAALFAERALEALVEKKAGVMTAYDGKSIQMVPLKDVVAGDARLTVSWLALAEMLAR